MGKAPAESTDNKEFERHAKLALKAISKTTMFIRKMESQGLERLKYLPNLLKALQVGLKEGQITVESAKESSEAVKKLSKDMTDICKSLDNADPGVCEAQEDRKYLARNTRFVVSDDPESVVSKTIKKSMKEWGPAGISKLFETLAKKFGK